MFFDTFSCRQLVHINCTASTYVSVRLDQHSVVLGTNNQGKTSLLNSVKFFLLPEENLNDCERKFGLKSSKGFYNKVESYGWYFPEDNSFMVLEAENHHGPFCIVLHRGLKPYSYGRIAVPVAYEQIKHLFWDFNSEANGGQGAPIATMQFKVVLAELKALGGESVTDSAAVKSRFFSHSIRPEEGRYCLIPLKKGGTSKEFEAWRRLIHLQFDISASDSRTLPETIATIIEGDMVRKEDQLSIRFDHILAEYAELRSERTRLMAIEAAMSDWARFTQACDAFGASSTDLIKQLINAEHSVMTDGAALMGRFSSASTALNDAELSHRESHGLETNKIGERNTLVGELKAESSALKKVQKEVDRLQTIYKEFGGIGPKEIIENLQEDIASNEINAESFRDVAKRAERFNAANREAKVLSTEIARIRTALESGDKTLLDQLDSHSGAILSSINQSLFSAFTMALGDDHKSAIQGFTSLFSSSSGGSVNAGPSIRFLGQNSKSPFVAYDAAELRSRLERELNGLLSEAHKNQAVIKELGEASKLSAEESRQKAADKDDLVTTARNDVALLQRCEYVEELHADKTLVASGLSEKIGAIEEELRALREVVAANDMKRSDARSAVELINKQRKSLEFWHAEISRFLKVDIAHLAPLEQGFEPALVEVTEATMTSIRAGVASLAGAFNKLRDNLRVLLEKQLLDGVGLESAFSIGLDWVAVQKQRGLFALIFSRLESEVESHKGRVAAHNHDTSCQIESIKDAKRQITTFIAELEDQLSEFQVSDLAGVKIDCKLHPQFEELLLALDNISLTTDNLHTEVLYNRIASFCDSFFDKTTRQEAVLSMSRLIESVDYRVRKIGDEAFTDVAQSTGTSLMINCRLLSILMKRLLLPQTRMQMPLFIDELSNLDDKNLHTAREIAEADGFFVFGATPTYTTSIGAVLRNYIHLSYFKAEQAYHPKRIVIFTGVSESLQVRPANEDDTCCN